MIEKQFICYMKRVFGSVIIFSKLQGLNCSVGKMDDALCSDVAALVIVVVVLIRSVVEHFCISLLLYEGYFIRNVDVIWPY